MSPFGFKSSGERYGAAGLPFGLAPARETMLFGRDQTDLREHSEGMDTFREIPYVLAGVLDGVPTEVFELKIRTRHESSSSSTTQWREERWLVAMVDLAERFPQISIHPRGALGRFFKGIGFKGIETGDGTFDHDYRVGSGDRDTTLRILHPDLRAWLVAQRPGDLRFELSGSCALVARRDWGPDEVGALLQTMRGFRGHLFGTPASQAPVPASVPAAGARFCGRCGTAVVPGARFCASCGAPVT